MLKGLQTFSWQDPALLADLKARGVDLVRLDLQRVADPGLYLEWIAQAQEAGLKPLCIVSDWKQIHGLPPGLLIELRNEVNLEGPDPPAYALLLKHAADWADRGGHTLYAPAISNLDRKGLAYLRALGPLPTNVHASVHYYAHGYARDPHPGFASRDAEVAALKAIIGDRPFAVTETGYHVAAQPRYTDWRKNIPGLTVRWTEGQIAAFVAEDFAFWEHHGAEFVVIYQLADGESDTPIDRYGIRGKYADNGQWYWKKVSEVFA